MPSKILGIDIQPHEINAVLLKSGLKSTQILGHVSIPIVKTDESDGWLSAIATLKQRLDISGAVCVSSFPASQISFRNITVPFKDEKRIRQMLPFELEPTIVCPIEEVVVDFEIIESGENTSLISVVTEIEKLQPYWTHLIASKIEPELIDIDSVPMALLFKSIPGGPSDYLFLDVGEESTTLIIVLAKKLRFIRSIPLNVTQKDFLHDLLSIIKQSLLYYKNHHNASFEIEKIIATGKSLTADIEIALEETFEIKVSRADLIKNMSIKIEKEAETTWNPYVMDKTLGLTLAYNKFSNVFNLRQGPFAIRDRFQEYKDDIIRIGLMLFMVGLAALGNLFVDNYILKQQVNTLNDEILTVFKQTLPEVTRIIDPLQQMKTKIDEYKKSFMVPGESEATIPVIEMLRIISNAISSDIKVTVNRMVISVEDIEIAGSTETFNNVDDIKNALEKSEHFKKVTISTSKADHSGEGVQFKLKIDLIEGV